MLSLMSFLGILTSHMHTHLHSLTLSDKYLDVLHMFACTHPHTHQCSCDSDWFWWEEMIGVVPATLPGAWSTVLRWKGSGNVCIIALALLVSSKVCSWLKKEKSRSILTLAFAESAKLSELCFFPHSISPAFAESVKLFELCCFSILSLQLLQKVESGLNCVVFPFRLSSFCRKYKVVWIVLFFHSVSPAFAESAKLSELFTFSFLSLQLCRRRMMTWISTSRTWWPGWWRPAPMSWRPCQRSSCCHECCLPGRAPVSMGIACFLLPDPSGGCLLPCMVSISHQFCCLGGCLEDLTHHSHLKRKDTSWISPQRRLSGFVSSESSKYWNRRTNESQSPECWKRCSNES